MPEASEDQGYYSPKEAQQDTDRQQLVQKIDEALHQLHDCTNAHRNGEYHHQKQQVKRIQILTELTAAEDLINEISNTLEDEWSLEKYHLRPRQETAENPKAYAS